MQRVSSLSESGVVPLRPTYLEMGGNLVLNRSGLGTAGSDTNTKGLELKRLRLVVSFDTHVWKWAEEGTVGLRVRGDQTWCPDSSRDDG